MKISETVSTICRYRPIRDTDNLPASKLSSEPPDGMKKFRLIQWDYKNIVRRKGKLVKLE